MSGEFGSRGLHFCNSHGGFVYHVRTNKKVCESGVLRHVGRTIQLIIDYTWIYGLLYGESFSPPKRRSASIKLKALVPVPT